ncbi:AEC family transporter [Candidatus Pacearchaeota archaeon]|nr:AEC family transporter [Candidatus Pacearchaeota archaeon]
MNKIILELIPIIIIFVIGFASRKFKILKKEDGDTLLKIIFYFTLPSLIIYSIPKIKLSGEMIFLPITAIWIVLITFFISFFVSRKLNLGTKSVGTFLVGSMIMEISFTLPFILITYGSEGLARIVLFDIGNTIMAFSFVYFIAGKYGKNNNFKVLTRKIIFSPPLLASLLGILLNLINYRLPLVLDSTSGIIGNLTIPLMMFSLGIYFNPKIIKVLPTSSGVFIRMFIGLTLGFTIAKIFGLDGMDRAVVLIGAAAPVCYNTLTFSSLENLDKEFAANLISVSILVGFLLIPLLIFLLK